MRHWLLAHLRFLLLVSALCAASSPAALAGTGCDLLSSGGTPLAIRRPVGGDEVRLTSGFGLRRHPLLNETRMHTGVDWAAPTGTPVLAAGTGRVVSAEHEGPYGNKVVIDHGDGWQTWYAQLQSFSVKPGDCVEANAGIGAVGSTGLSSGPHLHFEVHQGGQAVDPMQVPIRHEN